MSEDLQLHTFASDNGVQTSFIGVDGQPHTASPDTLRSILSSRGLLKDGESLRQATQRQELKVRSQLLEPVVLWQPGFSTFRFSLNCPSNENLSIHIEFESKSQLRFGLNCPDVSLEEAKPDNKSSATHRITIPVAIPMGYHKLTLTFGRTEASTLIICAPATAFPFPANNWALFAPLYGLRKGPASSFATYSDLAQLAKYSGEHNRGLVATLPLLATFCREPVEASPYRPISRRFWNELYLDLEKVPELSHCEAARKLLQSSGYAATSVELGQASSIDYLAIAAHRRKVLTLLVESVSNCPVRRKEMHDAFAGDPEALRYARFRADEERLGRDSKRWDKADVQQNPAGEDFHLYLQWQTKNQLNDCATFAQEHGSGLYLDLPVGVHPSGFDTFENPDLYATAMNIGAPPDALAPSGQNWMLPPELPSQARRSGYSAFRKVLEENMKVASVLRIDHVMGFQRLFWIPDGMPASAGAYVENYSEELFAIACLESQRHRCALVGEDLGTVAPSVRQEMHSRQVARMYVDQLSSDEDSIPVGCVASLNTHDTETFAASCENQSDTPAPGERLRKRLKELAASDAALLLLTLEDFWLEKRPQNIPGTSKGNWQRPLAKNLQEIVADEDFQSLLSMIAKSRLEGQLPPQSQPSDTKSKQ